MDDFLFKLPQYQIVDPYSEEFLFNLPTHFGKCLENTPPKREFFPLQNRLKQKVQREPKESILLPFAQNNLPQEGTLSVDERGFLYLDIPNAYIYELFTLLNERETTLPPYFEGTFSKGAHISAVLPYENRKLVLLPQLNKSIPFEITGCFSLSPLNSENWERVWFLTVEAPELEEVRLKLGLSPKIQGKEFHITFAVKKQFLSLSDLLQETEDLGMKTGLREVLKGRIESIRSLSENKNTQI